MQRKRRRTAGSLRRRSTSRKVLRGRRRGTLRKPPARVRKTVIIRDAGLARRAYEAGTEAAREHPHRGESGVSLRKWINSRWNDWRIAHHVPVQPWNYGQAVAHKFAEGFCSTSSGAASDIEAPDCIWIPTSKSVGVVITAMNEAKALTSVLDQLERLPLDEIIIVVNGSTDETFETARSRSHAVILHYPEPLGHDVGRAVGAKFARSEIVLFLDADFPVLAEQLIPFIDAVERGTDVALNNITPFLGAFAYRDSVTILKELLNRALGRVDLESNSLTAVPHALSRKALETIGYINLVVPPKAQAIAVRKGLKLSCPISVDIISKNRIRDFNTGSHNPVSRLIVGDHLEALSMLMRENGHRLGEPDRIRNRSLFKGLSV